MRRLRFSTAAQRDLDDIQLYVEELSGDERDANRVIDRLLDRCGRLAELPGALGRPRPDLRPGFRSFPERGYVIFFRYLDDDAIEIVNVLSAKRDTDDFPFEADEP